MSDALTPETPDTPATVPQGSLASDPAVDGGSAGGAAVVPVERFNGLMSTYNREKAEAQTNIEALQAELEAVRAEMNKETNSVPDDDVKQEVAALRELLLEERRENTLTKALEEYPSAKPFADLIVGGTPEDIREAARLIHERVALLTDGQPTHEGGAPTEGAPVTEEGSAPVTPVTPPAPEAGGIVSVSGDVTSADRKREAIEKKDFMGFLDAAWDEQSLGTAAVG